MKKMMMIAALCLPILLACGGEKGTAPAETKPIVVGSKNFSESILLGEIAAQQLEKSGCSVERRFNMGGTFVCDSALRSGGIDLYPEYSGTALTAILKQPASSDRADVNSVIAREYAAKQLSWGPELGFNNTFAMIVRKSDAQQFSLQRISDLKRVQDRFRPGFGYEFAERPDGWNGLLAKYGLHFATSPQTMDLGLTYKALASNQVDLIAGNSTDGLIDSLGLVALEDDQHYFPPYDAAFVARNDIGSKCGMARAAIDSLKGTIDEATMRRLNFEVDGKKRDVAEVAREWLSRRGGS
jgi:osmoprotectant transport system substrate-binding protein